MSIPSNLSATTADFYNKIKTALGMRESSNNYMATNQFGYLGKYQFGAAALIDLGYLAKNTSQQMLNTLVKIMADEEPPKRPPDTIESAELWDRHYTCIRINAQYWLGKDGVKSTKKGFLERPEIQEKCMDRWLVILQKTLIRIKVIDNETTAQESGGFICASHLIGPGGCNSMKQGIIKKDGNGVTGNVYYKLGYEAVSGTTNVDIPIPSEAKIENPSREPSTIPGVGAVVTTPATQLSGIGFSDPYGKYPLYTNEADTSRLMRHQNIRKTIIPGKDNTRVTGIKIAGGTDTWDQPPIPYNAEYPYNQVLETECGHVVELDSTPENERIHVYHKKGTFIEIDRNGTKVTRIVGDDYTILDRNGFISVSGNCNITVEGNVNLCVKNDLNLEVNGNLNAAITGSANWNVEGSWNVSAYGGASYRVNMGFGVVTKGNVGYSIGGSYSMMVDGKYLSYVVGKTDITSHGDYTFTGGASTTLKTYANLNLGSHGQMSFKSDSYIVSNGSKIYMNSDIKNLSPVGKKLFDVKPLENWQPPHLPKSLKLESYPPLATPIRSFETISEFDDNPDATQEEKVAHQKELTQKGLVAVNPLPPKTSSVTLENKAPDIAPINQPIPKFEPGKINVNDYVSKNFTLAMLIGKQKLIAQSGLTDVQIASNLTNLAINVLDPIKSKYPDMIISSGLRPMGKNPRSQHPLGMAVDMQFNAHPSADYIKIMEWILSNVAYDQCLLEYRTNSINSRPGSPVTWIHVSYSASNNRKMYFSMNNDERISPIGSLKQVTC